MIKKSKSIRIDPSLDEVIENLTEQGNEFMKTLFPNKCINVPKTGVQRLLAKELKGKTLKDLFMKKR